MKRVFLGLVIGVAVACGQAGDTAGPPPPPSGGEEAAVVAWGEERMDCGGGTEIIDLGAEPFLYRIDQCGQGGCVPYDPSVTYNGDGIFYLGCQEGVTELRLRWLDPR